MIPVDHAQREQAARDFKRNLVVIAGAGTGKTSLLVERILHLVLDHDTSLDRVAAITFTDKAAAEMRERVEEGLEAAVEILESGTRRGKTGEEAERVLARLGLPGSAGEAATRRCSERARDALAALDGASVTTIHSFVAEMLRRHPREAGIDPDFGTDVGGRQERAVFDELWDEHLASVFGRSGTDEQVAAWRPVLEKIPLADIEEVARQLASFRLVDQVQGGGDAARQLLHLKAFAASCLLEIEHMENTVAGDAGVNSNAVTLLASLRSIFTNLIQVPDARVPDQVAGLAAELPKSVTIGKNAGPDAVRVEGRLKRLLVASRKLEKIDFFLAGELESLLGGFVRRVVKEYLARGWLSFDGMIVLTRNLLRDHPRVRAAETRRFDHILIDEFQDNDPLQYEIAFLLAASEDATERDAYALRLRPGRLFIVGDPKQSIYRFRGADIVAFNRAVESVEREGGARLELTQNFRSVPEIVDPLNRLFSAYFTPEDGLDPDPGPLVAARAATGDEGTGDRVEVWSTGAPGAVADDRREAEAAAIADWIEKRRPPGVSCRDVALLLRSFGSVDIYLRALRRRGLPCVVAGGKEFFERDEVALLLGFLRAVVNPANDLALVSWLRSPVAGVPDAELQRYATAAEGRPWSLFAELDANHFEHLAPALAMIRTFHGRHGDRPLDEMARAALDETPLRLAVAVAHEGVQAVVNLDKTVRHIAELCADGALCAEDVLDYIEEVEARERSEGDSPLADETVDAVSIMTIHRAKGLEWPVVFVADLARESSHPPGDPVEVEPCRGPGGALPAALSFRLGDMTTPAWPGADQENRRHDDAEMKRLLYVAATRAADHLFLVSGALRGSPEKTWVGALGAWGYEYNRGFPDVDTLAGGAVLHRRIATVPSSPAGAADPGVDDGLLHAVRELGAACDAARRFDAEDLRSPSSLHSAPGEPVAGETRRAPVPGDRNAAIAAGTALHLLLEVWNREDIAWLHENAGRAARVAAARDRLDVPEVETRVRALLRGAHSGGLLARIASIPVLGCELPVLYRDDGGVVWHGSIDLVAGTLDKPEVIDYKTTSAHSRAELERIHEVQLGCYREGLGKALGLADLPAACIEAFVPDV